MIENLTFKQLRDYFKAAYVHRARLERVQLQSSAFTAWRIELTLSGILGGSYPHKHFQDFLESLGMLTKAEQRKALQKKRERLEATRKHVRQREANLSKIWEAQLR